MSDFETLLERHFAGTATEEDRAALETTLRSDAALRREYSAQMRLHALLLWRSGKMESLPGTQHAEENRVVEFATPRISHPHRWLAMAAALAVLCGVAALWHWKTAPAQGDALAIEDAENALWSDGIAVRAGEKVRRGALDLAEGRVSFRTAAGAMVNVTAPARLLVIHPMLVRVLAGRVTADVPERAHGFTIETTQARIVDLGTRFGVEAVADGHTDVVVFEGMVDVTPEGEPDAKRLVQGEGVRLEKGQPAARVENIHTGAKPGDWSAKNGNGLIRRVHDSIGAGDSAKFYEILPGALKDGTRAYVDRTHEWRGLDANGLPKALQGADLVRTFNDDKREPQMRITVELSRPATLYIFINKTPPAWVERAGFTNMGMNIRLDETIARQQAGENGAGIERIFSVWKLDVTVPGSVILGPAREGPTGAKAMYGIAATPLPAK